MRVLYLHAYQSFIWNQIVSRRIAKYGLTVLPGDIIRRKDKSTFDEGKENAIQSLYKIFIVFLEDHVDNGLCQKRLCFTRNLYVCLFFCFH